MSLRRNQNRLIREHTLRVPIGRWSFCSVCLIAVFMLGCGTTIKRSGTEQLLLSDAVDQAIAEIDFRPLAGRKVYLDPTFVEQIRGAVFVNAPYIISSFRQQMVAAGCLLQDDLQKADVILEARVGALGADGHEITYGLPRSTVLSEVSSALPNTPALPVIPELSVARVESHEGIAKLVVFAYERESGRSIWQSGIARSETGSHNTWVFGAGPFQKGTVHEGVRFAGRTLKSGNAGGQDSQPLVSYFSQHDFTAEQDQAAEQRSAERDSERVDVADAADESADLQ